MARPLKTGIDYFPFDVDNDSKLNSLIRKFGAIGFGSFVGLLQKIYKEGYYIKINDDFIEDFEAEYDLEDGFFNDLLEFLLRRNFFDNDLYTEEKILTSNGIQKRFLEATKRRKDSSITQFSLINVDNNVNNVDNNTQVKGLVRTNVDNSTQSKVNKSKLNNTKKSKPKKDPRIIEVIDYLNFKTNSNFKVAKGLDSRLNEGYTVEDAKKVIDIKCAEWIGTDQEIYLRPQTLFSDKFDGYLNQKVLNNVTKNKSQPKTFAQQQLERQSTKGIATAEQIEEASKNDDITLDELF